MPDQSEGCAGRYEDTCLSGVKMWRARSQNQRAVSSAICGMLAGFVH